MSSKEFLCPAYIYQTCYVPGLFNAEFGHKQHTETCEACFRAKIKQGQETQTPDFESPGLPPGLIEDLRFRMQLRTNRDWRTKRNETSPNK